VVAEADVDLIRRLFDSTTRRDFADARACWADDAVLRLHGFAGAGIATSAMGKPAIAEWFGDWFRMFSSDYHFDVHELRDVGGGQVLIVATHVARGRTAGVPLAVESGWLYLVRDGEIVRCDAYKTAGEARAAAQLDGS
jgi:ketosteroid isomerase-like protein